MGAGPQRPCSLDWMLLSWVLRQTPVPAATNAPLLHANTLDPTRSSPGAAGHPGLNGFTAGAAGTGTGPGGFGWRRRPSAAAGGREAHDSWALSGRQGRAGGLGPSSGQSKQSPSQSTELNAAGVAERVTSLQTIMVLAALPTNRRRVLLVTERSTDDSEHQAFACQ